MQHGLFPVIDPVATGENIARLRQARGLSVRDVQAFFGFEEPQAIYKWQRGKSLPSVDNLYALGALLKVPLDEILVSANTIALEQQAAARCSSFFIDVDLEQSARLLRRRALCGNSVFVDRLFRIRQKSGIALTIFSGFRAAGASEDTSFKHRLPDRGYGISINKVFGRRVVGKTGDVGLRKEGRFGCTLLAVCSAERVMCN